jgi:dUTP pyrophosphatase
MKLKIKKLNPSSIIPSYAKEGDACFDLTATSINLMDKYIEYGTGLAMEIPEGYVGLIFPRSSVTNKDLILKNSVGVVDSGLEWSKDGDFLHLHRNNPTNLFVS